MKGRDVVELIALAALWGAAFLFMRVAVPVFGPVALATLRVAGAALLLMPLLAAGGGLPGLRTHWQPIAVVGVTNSVLPFLLLAFAAVSLNAGLSSIFNSASPLFAALIAWLWLGDRLTTARVVGLVIGFAGVVGVVASRGTLQPGSPAWAVVACVLAAACYGFSAAFAKRYLAGVPPLATAAGSQLAAALVLAGPAAWWWPAQAPGAGAWLMVAVLALACTGLAYVLYFRLVASAGPVNAIAVTFLVPIFAVLWGALFLAERMTWQVAAGCAVIFVGTALATGLLRPYSWRSARTEAPCDTPPTNASATSASTSSTPA